MAVQRRKLSVKRFLVIAAALFCLMTARATAHAQDAGLNGKWHFVLDTEGGDREMDAEFSVDADGKVTGKFDKTAVAGTFKDGHMDLAFEMTSEEAGETATFKLVGKLDDAGALTGTWEFSSYSGAFKATHPKPAIGIARSFGQLSKQVSR
jgi:hypothetical protein